MSKTRILILEDNPADVELVKAELKKAKLKFTASVVSTKKEFVESLQKFSPDLILSDYALPQFDGVTAMKIALKAVPSVPFLIVTGTMDEMAAVECLKAGAADYVLKQHLGRLGPAIKNALERKYALEEQHKAEQALQEKEELFRNLVENISEIFYVTDARGKLVYGSPNLFATTGYRPEEIVGRSYTRLVFGEDRRRVVQYYQKCSEDGSLDTLCEFRAQPKRGKQIWVEQATRIVRDASGTVVEYRNVVRNITERKLAEEALRDSEQRYRMLFDANPLPMWVFDLETLNFLAVNDAAVQHYGYSREEFLSMTIKEIRPQEHVAPLMQDIVKVRQGAETRGIWKHRKKDGSLIDVEITAHGIEFLGRDARLVLANDVSERKRADALQGAVYNIAYAADRAQSIDELYSAVHQIIKRVMPADNFYISLYDEDNDLLSFPYFVDEYDKEDPGTPQPLRKSLTAYVIRTGKSLLCTAEYHEELVRRGEAEIIGTPSHIWLGVPLKVEQKTIGVMAVQHYSDEKAYGEVEKQMLEYVSSQVAKVIEQKKAQELLAESERKFRTLVEGMNEGLVVVDNNDVIQFVNRRMCEMVGYKQGELIGKVAHQILLRERDYLLLQEKNRSRQAGVSSQYEIQITKKSGELAWVFISGAPLYDAQGRVIGSIGIHADITARKKTEEALRQAEEKYHAIFEHAMIGIFQTTPDGRFLTANPAIARMLGYASADELIRSRTDIARQGYVDSQRREEYKRLIEQHGSVMGFEYEVYCKDGSTIWISEDSRAVRDAHGKLLYFEGYFVDIKERKLAEAALLQQSAYFRQLFESSPSAIVLRDKYGNVLDVNAAFTNMFQFTPEEVQGRSLVNLIVPAERKEEVEELAKRRSRGEIIQLETVRKRKDGSLVEVALTAYPIVIEGEQVGVFTIYVDASERKRLEEQLRQSQKLESLGTLAGGIAHDFNNILGIILGHITLLERMPSDPGKVAASTKAITQASHRGASLVQQLLTFARKADVLVESVRVNEIVREIEKLLKETFPKIIDVKFQLGEGLPSIAADATQVHQVILNLCVNARDAMLPAGGTLTITTGLVPGEHVQQKLPAAENKTYLDLSISDTGTGIDEATRSRIFEPFFTTKELGKGTGLGLSTVYGIVQYHGGEIDVETVLGKGTTFHVYFPIHTTVEKRDESIEESTDEAPGGTETILLVEDEDMLRELATIVLQMKGYTVLTARDGDEGLNVFQQHRNTIALVLSDMGLPKLGGYDMFKEMKKLNPGLRAVLASGYIEPGVKSDIFNAGVIDFIQKPFKPAVLLNKIRRALDLGK